MPLPHDVIARIDRRLGSVRQARATVLDATVEPCPSKWIEKLGIQDAESGANAARAAREKILEPARRVLGTTDAYTTMTFVFLSFVARAQCLHEASVQMPKAENPHAAFTFCGRTPTHRSGVCSPPPRSRRGQTVQWSSTPHLKSANDRLVAYAWVVELADATRHLCSSLPSSTDWANAGS